MFRIALLSVALFGALNAHASRFPLEASPQKTYVIHRGAALLAHVESTVLSRDVIGYKGSGFLAQRSPETLEAVVTARCSNSDQARTTMIRLGREWHGTGYMSAPLDFRTLFPVVPGPEGCVVRGDTPLQIAFSDGGGRWDPAGYNDIIFSPSEFYSSRTVYESTVPGADISNDTWEYLVGQMRR